MAPAFTIEYSGPGWVCHPELAPGSSVTTSMWKSVGSVRWVSMLSVAFPTASSLRLTFPDVGVAMAAVTPARLTMPHARATYLVRFMCDLPLVVPDAQSLRRWWRPFELMCPALLGSRRSEHWRWQSDDRARAPVRPVLRGLRGRRHLPALARPDDQRGRR